MSGSRLRGPSQGSPLSSLAPMQRRLLAVSVAVLAPTLGQAFLSTATGSSGARSSACPGRTGLAPSVAPPHRNQHTAVTMVMTAAAIVGGGRIGCALYVSVGFRVSNWIT